MFWCCRFWSTTVVTHWPIVGCQSGSFDWLQWTLHPPTKSFGFTGQCVCVFACFCFFASGKQMRHERGCDTHQLLVGCRFDRRVFCFVVVLLVVLAVGSFVRVDDSRSLFLFCSSPPHTSAPQRQESAVSHARAGHVAPRHRSVLRSCACYFDS